MNQRELYERFRDLHAQKGGFIMPNAWDGASALILKRAGFQALGTSSAALAFTLGRPDGRHAVSREEHIDNALLLGRLTGGPGGGGGGGGGGGAAGDGAAAGGPAI